MDGPPNSLIVRQSTEEMIFEAIPRSLLEIRTRGFRYYDSRNIEKFKVKDTTDPYL